MFRVAEDLRELVKVAAVHHVRGRKRVAEVVETEVLDLCPFEHRAQDVFFAGIGMRLTQLQIYLRLCLCHRTGRTDAVFDEEPESFCRV